MQSLLEQDGNGDRVMRCYMGQQVQNKEERSFFFFFSILSHSSVLPEGSRFISALVIGSQAPFYLVLISNGMKFSSSRSLTPPIHGNTTVPTDMTTSVTVVGLMKRRQHGWQGKISEKTGLFHTDGFVIACQLLSSHIKETSEFWFFLFQQPYFYKAKKKRFCDVVFTVHCGSHLLTSVVSVVNHLF